FTIVAFGDSLTRGYGLPEDQGFVPQLQAWLHENGGENITVLNAGLSGDTTAGGLARIDWTLTDDVDAVIVALGGNDMLRGIFPTSSHENLDGIVALLTERALPVMLVGLPAPTNFGPEFKEEFDGMYSAVADKYETLLYPYFFEGFGASQDTAALTQYLQDDATHPNAEGVLLIVAHMGPMVLELAR
ncbi:MAG: arylesterase, partial [Rhodobacteraceae bacterium]|nr:arylesterase [Paracoccaceae bacterium]